MKRLSILTGSTLLLLSMAAPLSLTAQMTSRRTSPGELAANVVESYDAPLPRLGPFTWRRQIVRIGGTIQTFLGGGDTREIDRSQVERVGDGRVYLRLDKEDIIRGKE